MVSANNLLDSGERIISGVGDECVINNIIKANGIMFNLYLTDANNLGTDTLDVFVQEKIGNWWDDIAHFTQILGNGADTKDECAIISFIIPQTDSLHNIRDGSLAVSALQGPIKTNLRVSTYCRWSRCKIHLLCWICDT